MSRLRLEMQAMKSVQQKDIARPENNKDGQVSENDQSQKGARFCPLCRRWFVPVQVKE